MFVNVTITTTTMVLLFWTNLNPIRIKVMEETERTASLEKRVSALFLNVVGLEQAAEDRRGMHASKTLFH
jgi:hypothetical protein